MSGHSTEQSQSFIEISPKYGSSICYSHTLIMSVDSIVAIDLKSVNKNENR